MTFSRDARKLLVMTHSWEPYPTGQTWILDVERGATVTERHLRLVGSLPWASVMSPDGKWIAVPRGAGASIYRTSDLKHEKDLQFPGDMAMVEVDRGKERLCATCTFSPDSRLLLVANLKEQPSGSAKENSMTGRKQSIARLWDLRSGKEIAGLRGGVAGSFNADGGRVALRLDEGLLQVWQVTPSSPVAGLQPVMYLFWLCLLVSAGWFWLAAVQREWTGNPLSTASDRGSCTCTGA